MVINMCFHLWFQRQQVRKLFRKIWMDTGIFAYFNKSSNKVIVSIFYLAFLKVALVRFLYAFYFNTSSSCVSFRQYGSVSNPYMLFVTWIFNSFRNIDIISSEENWLSSTFQEEQLSGISRLGILMIHYCNNN